LHQFPHAGFSVLEILNDLKTGRVRQSFQKIRLYLEYHVIDLFHRDFLR